jgi:hypothetical protein
VTYIHLAYFLDPKVSEEQKKVTQKKCPAVTLSVLLVIFVALAAYGECSEDATLTNKASVVVNTQVDSEIQSNDKNLSKIPPSINGKITSFALIHRFEDHPFRELFSQQDLFRFEEVYRL